MALKNEKAMGPLRSPMAFIPPSGLDLWVTLTKIKEVVEVKHFYLSGYYYKTQKNRLVKEFGTYPRFSLILFGLGGMNGS